MDRAINRANFPERVLRDKELLGQKDLPAPSRLPMCWSGKA